MATAILIAIVIEIEIVIFDTISRSYQYHYRLWRFHNAMIYNTMECYVSMSKNGDSRRPIASPCLASPTSDTLLARGIPRCDLHRLPLSCQGERHPETNTRERRLSSWRHTIRSRHTSYNILHIKKNDECNTHNTHTQSYYTSSHH